MESKTHCELLKKEIIEKTVEFAKEKLSGESSGHDWWHVYRVWNNAKAIMQSEDSSNDFVVELAALLHDIADWKFHNGDDTIGPKVASEFLHSLSVDADTIEHVCNIIATISFKGANVKTPMSTIEGKIVQDADRLDAIGAIGIARAFAYGGHMGRDLYNPEIKPSLHNSYEDYKNSKGHTINHFYEKLLLLSNKMNTKKAREIALERQAFMEEYLKRFFAEWEGQL